MLKKKGTTAISKQIHQKKLFTNPSAITDVKFKGLFDREKTWGENMKAVNFKDMYSDSLPEFIPDKASWTLPKLSEDELAVVQKLISAHGETQYRKMFFDRKINIFQWTEEQCERKVNLLKENRVHICNEGKCLCGSTPNSSYVPRKDRIRR
jgi:hypothetical protein